MKIKFPVRKLLRVRPIYIGSPDPRTRRTPMERPGQHQITLPAPRYVQNPAVRIVQQRRLLPTIDVHPRHRLPVGHQQLPVRRPGQRTCLLGLRHRRDCRIPLYSFARKYIQGPRISHLYRRRHLAVGRNRQRLISIRISRDRLNPSIRTRNQSDL